MIEAERYPQVLALFADLFELSEAERQLPLDLLLNVNRARLRAPMLALLELTEAMPQDEDVLLVLTERFPQVPRHSAATRRDPVKVRTINTYYRALSAHNSVAFPDERVHEISTTVSPDDQFSYPAFILYMLGFAEASREQGLALMELLLGGHPAVGAMLIDLAEVRPV